MFGLLKKKLEGGAQRLNGNTDLLEAIAAACALVAAADGDISDQELDTAINAVAANSTLSAAFDARTINAVMDKMLAQANTGRMGKRSLMKEVEDVAGKPDSEMVLLIALDIADSDGNIDADERAVLDKIAATLSLKVSDFE